MCEINEEKIIKAIINELLSKGICQLPKIALLSEENSTKFQIIKIISQKSNEDHVLQILNIMNLPPGCEVKKDVLLFLEILKEKLIKEMIQGMDAISTNYNELKKEKKFIEYLNEKKMAMHPFLTMIDFIAYINTGKEVSSKIKQFMKNKYIKSLIDEDIEAKRSSLWKIIYLYNNLVLHAYEDVKNTDNNETANSISLTDLKIFYNNYVCFNDLYNQGEISNFINCLNKSITLELICIYLAEGPDYNSINKMINDIFKEMYSNFSKKDYFLKASMNQLYDSISKRIDNFANQSTGNNYAKLVIKYCQFHKQGSKNIVFTFFTGLNPKYVRDAFNKISFDDIELNDFYKSIPALIENITSKKKDKKKSIKHQCEKNKANVFQENKVNIIEENEINIIEEHYKENKQIEIAKNNGRKNDGNKAIINDKINTNVKENINDIRVITDKVNKSGIEQLDNNNKIKTIKTEYEHRDKYSNNIFENYEKIIMREINKKFEEKMETMNEEMNKKVKVFKKENEQMKKKIEDFQKENEQMKMENEQMKKKIEDFEKENEQMKIENEQMKKKS